MSRRAAAGLVALGVLVLPACTADEDEPVASGTPEVSASADASASPSSGTGPSTSTATSNGSGAEASGSPSPFPASSGPPGEGDDVVADSGEEAAAGLPFPADTSEDTGEASGGPWTVVDLRIGRQDGFDRVVFEAGTGSGGEGTPGWRVRYTDDPRTQGRGDVVEVAGDATLEVVLTGTGYPFDTGVEPYDGPNPYAVRSTELVTEVRLGAVFEGQTLAFVGVTEEAPFRVYALADPPRVVLEVASR